MAIDRSKEPAAQVLIWDKTHETMPRDQLRKLQLERLQAVVERVYQLVPFYRRVFEERGLKPSDVSSLEDLSRLPFTTKQDLRDHYPFGMFAVPLEQVVRVHASSGTTGKPVVGGYTYRDLDLWSELMARTLTSAGVTSRDVIHNAYGYGLFTGGLGFHMGAERIGATVVPISGGITRRQIMLMEDFGATVLTCTPSYALVLAEAAKEAGIDIHRRMKVRVGVFGAEPWTNKMREEIEQRMGLEAFDIYGLTELIGPGVSVECPYHDGLHIFEDHFLPEVIDPESGETLGYGEEGELVFTSLTKEAFPVIRFRTRDRTSLTVEPCPCGRTLVRMQKIKGRTDDMLIVRGVNVFPSQIEGILMAQEGLEPHYLIVVDREKNRLDELEVRVEASEELFRRGSYWIRQMEEKIRTDIHQTIGISCKVRVLEPKQIQRSEGKAKRVIDLRDLGE